jgi:hypothetical protein
MIGMLIIIVIGLLARIDLLYQIPSVYIFLINLTAYPALRLSKFLAVKYTIMRKRRFLLFSDSTIKLVKYPQFEEKSPSYRWVALLTLMNVFGMAYLILFAMERSGVLQPQDLNSRATTLLLLSLLTLPTSVMINVTAWLLRINHFMLMKKKEGEVTNIGKSLQKTLLGFFGVTAIFNYGYETFRNTDYTSLGVSFSLVVLLAPPIFFVYHLIKKMYLEKMRKKLDDALQEHLDDIE